MQQCVLLRHAIDSSCAVSRRHDGQMEAHGRVYRFLLTLSHQNCTLHVTYCNAFLGTRTPEEVVAKVKTFRSQDASGLMSTVKSEISAKSAPSAVSAPASAAPKSSPSLAAAATPDVPAAAASSATEEDDWTSSEQKALEVQMRFRELCQFLAVVASFLLQLALKEFPASMAPADRWKAIATR